MPIVRIFIITIIALLLFPLSFGCKKNPEVIQLTSYGRVAPLINHQAPDFSLANKEGKTVSLSDFRGKVVVLHFWATWCFPCKDEMPSLEKFYEKFKDKGLEVLAVSVDEGGWVDVNPFLKEIKVANLPVLIDEDFKTSLRYHTFRYPESYIIDRSGIIIDKVIGAIEWHSAETEQVFEEILSK